MKDTEGVFVSFEGLSKEQQLDILLALFEVASVKLEKHKNMYIVYIPKENKKS